MPYILALILIYCFASLGLWQLDRAKEKTSELNAFNSPDAYISVKDLSDIDQYKKIKATGRYLNDKQIIIDNIIRDGKIGQMIISPFEIDKFSPLILVNRGWLPKNSDIENEIDDLTKDSANKKAEFEKLKSLIETGNTTKQSIASTKKDKDTLHVAGQLLKDSGIKTRIIKTYLPTMNKLINQYLQGMDFYVNFTLDENFEETIKSRYRDVFSYESFSEGEKARIDIALLLTWRSVAKLKNSVDTNLLILDEIFDGSLDQSGSSDLGWILRNFDDSTNVFVISHKESMTDKFQRTLTVEKPKNYSMINEY